MKELSIEQKAKAYDEAIEKIQKYVKDEYGCTRLRPEDIFPELKDEDEMIRKALIKYFSEGMEYLSLIPYSKKQCIAWLEEQGERKPAMIQWKGDNLKEVVVFTGVYKEGFAKWFHNSWEEYEKYVHEHGDIFKIFNEDGSHMEVPVGAWIIKAPDGYNTASRFVISPILTEISIESNFKFKKAIEAIENYVNSFPHSQRPEIWQHINFLKSIKATTTKEWSEEDENLLKLSLSNLTELKERFGEEYGRVGDCIAWLKSLRYQSQWKPSDKQIYSLDRALRFYGKGNEVYDSVKELLEQLKKLREE